MTTIESRLRESLGALADQVEPEPAWQARVTAAVTSTGRGARLRAAGRRRGDPVPAPARHRAIPRPGREAGHRVGDPVISPAPPPPARRLLPAIVALVVVLAVGAGVVLSRVAHVGDGSAAKPAVAPVDQAEPARPFFLLLRQDRVLTVRSTGSGAVSATVPPPAGAGAWVSVQASSDPAVFFVAAMHVLKNIERFPSEVTLYRLTVDQAGAIMSLTAVTSWRKGSTEFAVSPDETRIAIFSLDPLDAISVIAVGSDHTETFELGGGGVATGGRPVGAFLRWTADGRQILFSLQSNRESSPGVPDNSTEIWALDPTGARDDLITAYRQVASFGPLDYPFGNAEILTTVDRRGTRSYVASLTNRSSRAHDVDMTARLVDVDPANGRPIRVLLDVTHHNWPGETRTGELTADPSGRYLVYDDGGQLLRVIDVDRGTVRTLPLDGAALGLAW